MDLKTLRVRNISLIKMTENFIKKIIGNSGTVGTRKLIGVLLGNMLPVIGETDPFDTPDVAELVT